MIGRVGRELGVLREKPWKIRTAPRAAYRTLRAWGGLKIGLQSQSEAERLLFGEEVDQMRETAHLQPIDIGDPNTSDVIAQVKALDPYFMLTLGGAIYRQPLLEAIRGFAINQHDGWCPEYKGANTVHWTLYRRDVGRVGNTVHLLTAGMDAGPILRRSTACLCFDDTLPMAFTRTVALGTELMCESVDDILHSDEITVYDQPEGEGATFLAAELTREVTFHVVRDLRDGLIARASNRLRSF